MNLKVVFMKRSWWYRFSFFLVLLIISGVSVVPTVFNHSKETQYPVKSKINLGLDLQGGLYMILGIDFKKVFKDEIFTYMERVNYTLKEEGIGASLGSPDHSVEGDPYYSIKFNNTDDIEKAKDVIRKGYAGTLRLTKESGTELFYGISKVTKTQIETQSVGKSIEVIRNRIDEFGVTEPEIVSQGKDRIVVALPGVKNIERAKALIGKTAKLEFKIVNDEVNFPAITAKIEEAKKQGIEYKKGALFSAYLDKLNAFMGDTVPKGYQIAFEKRVNKKKQ
jgi:preprotein translocase subunit SecD